MKHKIHNRLRILLLENIADGRLLNDITYRKATLNDKTTLKKYIKDFIIKAVRQECDDKSRRKI